jgi:uncharacterized membrane protein
VSDTIPTPIDDSRYNQEGVISPDYSVNRIIMPTHNRWIEPGMIISPTITIRNEGTDDLNIENRTISASLGLYPLISKNNGIPPLKKGESIEITLEFLIPDGIPSREYPFMISVNTGKPQTDTDRNIREKVSGTLTIRTITPNVRINNCGCS